MSLDAVCRRSRVKVLTVKSAGKGEKHVGNLAAHAFEAAVVDGSNRRLEVVTAESDHSVRHLLDCSQVVAGRGQVCFAVEHREPFRAIRNDEETSTSSDEKRVVADFQLGDARCWSNTTKELSGS